MEQQRERARAASKFSMHAGVEYRGEVTEFRGYDTLRVDDARVLAIYREGTSVPAIEAGEDGVIVLDRTPFYAESGGQVGDRGELLSGDGGFVVDDTLKIQADVFGHKGRVGAGRVTVGDLVVAQVNAETRQRAAYNHSATHLMHAALRTVLGSHVQQKGSLVTPERTRFDFSHGQPLTAEEIARVEQLVNREIRRNVAVEARRMKYDEAIKAGAMALFGEKYGDEVRVIGMGDFSTELCGGTHVRRSGDIGFFKVVAESGVAAGVRRIEAVTAEDALTLAQSQERQIADIAGTLKAAPSEVGARLAQMVENVRSLEKELARMKSRLAASQGDDLAGAAVEVKGVKVLAATMDGADGKALRETVDKLKDKLGSALVVLGSVEAPGKVTLIAGVTQDLTSRVRAGDLVGFVAAQVGGKGGGRPDMAQGGGTDAAGLGGALASVAAWAGERL
jgi:alanyl-tRNA synthetase